MRRRHFLLAAGSFALSAGALRAASFSAVDRLAGLEKKAGGRLGVFAQDTGRPAHIAWRADERFALCSTFKLLLCGAILQRAAGDDGLPARRIGYAAQDLVAWSPITEKTVGQGLSVAELCAAALQYSDNTAANLLLRELGGPAALNAFAQGIGNLSFRLDRWETDLNSAIPGDPRDTATPADMAHSLNALCLGDALPAAQRRQLNDWLLGNTTGGKRIRAALPEGWQAGDKTGSGDYGSANDIAVLWPPHGAPLVLAIYYTQEREKAPWRDEVIADATRIVLDALR
ncbi:MAG: class A beta-lactamase [Azonexaceae bacterium]|nr:class A beta-lactamase [Azonexaceae bacterium]